ncbi:geranylgeranylglycerol-phosphate geranylgeranyltransferase [candidate division KSB1 bacterium]
MITAVSVWIGYNFVVFEYSFLPFWIAGLSGALICAGGNVFNDIFDAEIDRINNPDRPLAAGEIKVSISIFWGTFLFLTGTILSYLINTKTLIIAVLTVVLLMVYNVWAKKIMLLGNMIVSILTGLAFIFGGFAADPAKLIIVPAIFSFLYHLGREILKDIEDITGDKRAGLNTFPIQYGISVSIYISMVIFTLLIIATLIPYFFLNYSIYYLVLVIGGVDLLIIGLMVRYLRNRDQEVLSQTNKYLKIGMVLGLAALLLR